MTGSLTALVTGAEGHQGLAVIRGLGLARVRVVAAGAHPHSLGFYSRFATHTARYTSPFQDTKAFVEDVLAIIRRTAPDLVIPAVESTLVALNARRAEIERHTILAAPEPAVLEYALDKGRTLDLAASVGVPIPRTARGGTARELLTAAARLRFPVAVKPRGNRLHPATAHRVDFKVRYARSLEELATLLAVVEADAAALLVQEFTPGMGRCVAAVCRHGEPLVLFPYERTREYPLSGGVSVVRRTIPLDQRLATWTTALLQAARWHGAAMVEYKYDRRLDRHTLMEINGRFQASTALSLDAGVNLPRLAACVHMGLEPPRMTPRVGVTERWLRGDVLALDDALARHAPSLGTPPGRRPALWSVLWPFLRDFRPGIRYDEFKWWDAVPGFVEGVRVGGMMLRMFAGALLAVMRAAGQLLMRMLRRPTVAPHSEAQPALPFKARHERVAAQDGVEDLGSPGMGEDPGSLPEEAATAIREMRH
jgi:predicted ATP-grasp superfamily ATP-dependent carboligase